MTVLDKLQTAITWAGLVLLLVMTVAEHVGA